MTTDARTRIGAKDIPTEEILRRIAAWDPPRWNIGASVIMINGWDRKTDFALHVDDWPEKILRAKLSRMLRNGLIDGCCCGCRGDFVLTDKGRALLHSPAATQARQEEQ